MNKNDFFSLADKYSQGACSPQERELIEDFCEKAQVNEISARWSLSEEESVRIRLLKKILKSVDLHETETFREQRSQKSFGVVWRVAASIALIIGMSYLIYHLTNPEVSYVTKTTARGQRETVTLSDGSVIRLNAESSISYPETFGSSSEREIRLQGEAFFEVKRDSLKPFIVKTEDLTTTVLGTSFNIQAYPDDDNITITVATGKVQINSVAKGAARSQAILLPGHQVVYDMHAQTMAREEVSLDKYLAWKDDIIILDRMTLAEAAEILGRWYDVEFILENERMKSCMINGEFRNDGLHNILEHLKFLINLEYEVLSGNQIVLRGESCN